MRENKFKKAYESNKTATDDFVEALHAEIEQSEGVKEKQISSKKQNKKQLKRGRPKKIEGELIRTSFCWDECTYNKLHELSKLYGGNLTLTLKVLVTNAYEKNKDKINEIKIP